MQQDLFFAGVRFLVRLSVMTGLIMGGLVGEAQGQGIAARPRRNQPTKESIRESMDNLNKRIEKENKDLQTLMGKWQETGIDKLPDCGLFCIGAEGKEWKKWASDQPGRNESAGKEARKRISGHEKNIKTLRMDLEKLESQLTEVKKAETLEGILDIDKSLGDAKTEINSLRQDLNDFKDMARKLDNYISGEQLKDVLAVTLNSVEMCQRIGECVEKRAKQSSMMKPEDIGKFIQEVMNKKSAPPHGASQPTSSTEQTGVR